MEIGHVSAENREWRSQDVLYFTDTACFYHFLKTFIIRVSVDKLVSEYVSDKYFLFFIHGHYHILGSSTLTIGTHYNI